MEREFKRSGVYYADLGQTMGSEQSGLRPVVILQNDVGNKYSPTIIVAPVTSQISKKNIPTHSKIKNDFLNDDSIVLLEQIRTIDKNRMRDYVGTLNADEMKMVERALLTSLGFNFG